MRRLVLLNWLLELVTADKHFEARGGGEAVGVGHFEHGLVDGGLASRRVIRAADSPKKTREPVETSVLQRITACVPFVNSTLGPSVTAAAWPMNSAQASAAIHHAKRKVLMQMRLCLYTSTA